MPERTFPALAGLLLLSHGATASITDHQWGDWYGNISAMESELNIRNTSGEVLTLTCTSGKLAAAYSVPAEDYRLSSQAGLAEPGLRINGKDYLLDENAFTALKSAGNKGVIKITSMKSAISGTFSAKGLASALADTSWQDCITH